MADKRRKDERREFRSDRREDKRRKDERGEFRSDRREDKRRKDERPSRRDGGKSRFFDERPRQDKPRREQEAPAKMSGKQPAIDAINEVRFADNKGPVMRSRKGWKKS